MPESLPFNFIVPARPHFSGAGGEEFSFSCGFPSVIPRRGGIAERDIWTPTSAHRPVPRPVFSVDTTGRSAADHAVELT
ncbi:MAG: hypothetical protein H8E82_01330 [Candidatus Marinimicrobia bacterium]|nr:hypothetical protein [Candidatus Neomarinimicrobiota bacterium]